MASTFRDRWIECNSNEIRIRVYYVLWGTKRVPYSSIRSVRRVALSTFRGIWGTASPRYWASLDPRSDLRSQPVSSSMATVTCDPS